MDVDCLAFTGSTAVGRMFQVYAGESNGKRVSLELGGKSPQVVLADADLDAAAAGVAAGIFSNAGQVCNAGSRVVVQDGIKDKLLEKVVEKAREIVVGDPFDAATKMGPLVSAEQYGRVLSYMETGLEPGATIATGGGKLNEETGGYYVAPTIFDNVNNDMRIAREEIFGPVLSVIEVASTEEAIQLANDTEYGLAASVFSGNVRKAIRAAREIRAGTVTVNCYGEGDISTPFGGYKQSGFGGRDNSIHAHDQFTEMKTIWIDLTDPKDGDNVG